MAKEQHRYDSYILEKMIELGIQDVEACRKYARKAESMDEVDEYCLDFKKLEKRAGRRKRFKIFDGGKVHSSGEEFAESENDRNLF